MADASQGYRITGPVPLTNATCVEQAQVMRLCIFMNVIQTLHHLAFAAEDKKTDDRFGAFMQASHDLVTTLLLIGVLKEGADAMRDFTAEIDRIVKGLAKAAVDDKPIADAWVRLKEAIDKGNALSLWNRHLRHARDKAAFHWSRDEIEKVGVSESGAKAPYIILRETGDSIGTARFLLADEVLGRIAFPDAARNGDLEKAVVEVRCFATDVIRVLGIVIPAYIQERGGVVQPFGDV